MRPLQPRDVVFSRAHRLPEALAKNGGERGTEEACFMHWQV